MEIGGGQLEIGGGQLEISLSSTNLQLGDWWRWAGVGGGQLEIRGDSWRFVEIGGTELEVPSAPPISSWEIAGDELEMSWSLHLAPTDLHPYPVNLQKSLSIVTPAELQLNSS